MQAIKISYKGPTASKGARIVAQCEAGRLSIPYEHGLDMEGNVIDACKALCKRMGWDRSHGHLGAWAVGQLPNGDWVAVYTHHTETNRFCVE